MLTWTPGGLSGDPGDDTGLYTTKKNQKKIIVNTLCYDFTILQDDAAAVRQIHTPSRFDNVCNAKKCSLE